MSDVDEALRVDSRQWSDALPAPADLDEHLDRLYARSLDTQGRRWIVPALAAAAVVALAIGLAFSLGNRHGPATVSGANGTTSPGSTTTVARSSPSAPVVPAVVGLSGFTAVHRLLHADFWTIRFVAHASPQPLGTVLAQTPRGGAAVPDTAQSIRLTVSAGPNPSGRFITVPGIGTCTFTNPPSNQPCVGGPILTKVVPTHGDRATSYPVVPGRVALYLELTRATAPADGGPITAAVHVINGLGHPFAVPNACNGLVQVGLEVGDQPFGFGNGLVACAGQSIPTGETVIPVVIATTYSECSQNRSRATATSPYCQGPAHSEMPSLPPGLYPIDITTNSGFPPTVTPRHPTLTLTRP